MAEAATIHNQLNTGAYVFADAIQPLAEARAEKQQTGLAILDERRRQGQEAGALLPVDALSTAHEVLTARSEFGLASVEYKERLQGLKLDCQRLVAEWYRKKKPEYFPPVRHSFDEAKQEFFSHGLSIRQMTENALVPIVDDPEEEARRLNERVEDATPQLVRGLGLAAIGIRTISECTDKAIEDYESDMRAGRKHRGYRGYVPEIQKLMIRDIRLDAETSDRFEEQIGLPGIFITHEILQMALERRGLDASGLGKTELHGAQMLVSDDLLEFARLLDDVASEQWCVNIFMGEQVPADFYKDYTNFRHEALQRQAELKDISDGVATFILGLAEAKADRQQAVGTVEEFVKAQLLHLVKTDFETAEQVFDTKTAHGLQEVAYLESIGQITQANERLQEIQQSAPGGGFCGAGSCGLIAVNELSSEASTAREIGLGSGLIKDTVRKCKNPECGAKSILYDAKGNKACTTCKSSQIAGKVTLTKKSAGLAA